MNKPPDPPDPLGEYNRKRDFSKTAEPAGKRASSKGGNRFIVQKHAASRLHWDFRLEVDGVLKSWAVTKGPSPDPDIKRLAVRTEDHPLNYADFEGVIPKGEYGGGSVMLWDKGTWAPIEGKSAKDLEKGHLHFILEGERMKGEWLLIRLKPKGGEKRENWLLRKLNDEYSEPGDQLIEHGLTSVLTGRSMAEIEADPGSEFSLEGKNGTDFAKVMDKAAAHNRKRSNTAPSRAKASELPEFRKPQLATLVDAVPEGSGWMHEIKLDGYRALIAAHGDKVIVYTRTGKNWTDRFAPLVERIKELDLPCCLIDGEVVAYDKKGNPDFSSLQKVLKRGHGGQGEDDAISFHAFDLLELDGEDLTGFSNVERKERLHALLGDAGPPVHVTDHVIGAGEKLLRTMCNAGQEGIISKQIDASYQNSRTKAWLKVKCILRQEFVIIGWNPSKAAARPFRSLLLAQYENGELVYKGNVGTGFNTDRLHELAKRMKPLERKTMPAEVPRPMRRGVTWLKPDLVAEIAFTEFTHDGHLRHPSFIALREDKAAKDVTPEKPVSLEEAERKEIVRITNRDRVIFPESGNTKGELADYYAAVAPLILPFASHRPLTLVRCPQGRAKKCFYQKHDSGSFGPHVHHVPVVEKRGNTEEYLYIDDAPGLLACVQMGTIEFHGWGSRSADVEAPDRMVFDLDPDVGLDFAAVKSAAEDIRQRLADMGLVSFAMLSGGKGVHVIVPLKTGHSWDVHKDFSHRFAEAMALAEPDRFTANLRLEKREGRIFIDYLRNQRGSTAVMPYSTRSRPGAPVALPIAWGELKGFDNAHPLSIDDADKLIRRAKGKGLSGWGFADQSLPDF
ncbi:DNA ligase D [Altericroceibacterium xinjiangense]|uniref:DNA ligase D n=1 Tax=Altericroceibacterium xinjiangense TaxID=762261 RepID=UPI000F7F5B81|nr:DNA ligase D [Altericroceibacterium xinjiangense]